MLSKASAASPDAAAPPEWLTALLGVSSLAEGASFETGGRTFVVRGGIPRSQTARSAQQDHTSATFGFKWNRRESFDSAASRARMREWLVQRYGDVARASWICEHGDRPLLLDAGCGAAWSSLELFGPVLPRVRYLGVDLSDAVEMARERFDERGLQGCFMQADLNELPLLPGSVDLIFAEGVLHHMPSTEKALKLLALLLKPRGRFLFYVYRRKGPLREFTDDYVRAQLQQLSPTDAWRALEPLTRLGVALGELDEEIDIAEPIEVLGIPAGRLTIQRLFYWHVAKTFYRPDLTFEEMHHINFDWYTPVHAHRQSPDDVRRWCAEACLSIEREVVEDAGITVVARRT
jgi:SAM-dependent methyltransferase